MKSDPLQTSKQGFRVGRVAKITKSDALRKHRKLQPKSLRNGARDHQKVIKKLLTKRPQKSIKKQSNKKNFRILKYHCPKRERSQRGALVILWKVDANGRVSVCDPRLSCANLKVSRLYLWWQKTPHRQKWKHREYIDAKKCPKLTIGNAQIFESIWGLQNTTLTPTIAIQKTSRVYEVRMSQKSNVWTPSDAKTLTNLCKKTSVCVTYWRSVAWRTKSARGFAHTCPAGTF